MKRPKISDRHTAAVCAVQRDDGLDNARALEAENKNLRAALSELSDIYTHCWDLVDGGLLLMPSSIARFEKANAAARKALGFTDFDEE